MADIDPNFTCSDPGLSHTNITTEVWMIQSEGPFHESSITAVAICQVIIMAIGIPWNAIVLASIVIKQRYKEPTYVLLINLVVADLLVCLLVLPFNVESSFAQEFSIGNSDYTRCQVCHTIVITIVALVFISLFTLALMSVDRLIFIKWSFQYTKYLTLKLVLITLCLVWVFCILVSIPPVFGFGEIKFANVLSSCSLLTVGETPLTANINYIIFLVFIGAFPFMTTLIVNFWLLIILCKNMSSRHKRHADNSRNTFDSSEKKTIREKHLTISFHKEQIHLAQIFGAIFTANVITWVPTIAIALVAAVIGSENVPPPTYAFVYLSYVSQPAIHPVLETCLMGKARTMIFRSLCCCIKKFKQKRISNSNTIALQNNKTISTVAEEF